MQELYRLGTFLIHIVHSSPSFISPGMPFHQKVGQNSSARVLEWQPPPL